MLQGNALTKISLLTGRLWVRWMGTLFIVMDRLRSNFWRRGFGEANLV
jgi:hypothetical protein